MEWPWFARHFCTNKSIVQLNSSTSVLCDTIETTQSTQLPNPWGFTKLPSIRVQGLHLINYKEELPSNAVTPAAVQHAQEV